MYSVDIEPNKEERQEKLDQDFDRPFCPPWDVKECIPNDFPSLDTGIDLHEWYDEGRSAAAEADIVHNRTIRGYRQKNDE